ncbi:MAG: GlsB/YeaQ/YmgE family stress response membrane protein [Planctomycetaceae bacterium]|nr:GlsB/YeaQ/YmgE family stress response membrane protein [Planctomycetaceae bacterium]
MGILSWIVFGLIAGALAKWLMPGPNPGGCIVTVILGVVGAFVGGYLGTLLGMGKVDGFDVRSFFLAVVGAIVVLAIHRAISKK